MAKKKKGEFSITDMSEAVAVEMVRALRERQETLSKLYTQNLAQGQHQAAAKVKGTMDDLEAVVEDLQEQINPDGGAEEEAEEEAGDEGEE